MTADHVHKIFIVSDGTARTCEQVVRSALVQFENEDVELVIRSEIRNAAQAKNVVREAAEAGGIIFYTLVSERTKRAIRDGSHDYFVEAVDVLGPVFSGLNSIIHRRRRARPGLFYQSEREYFDRIDAIDYTLKHDDGQRLQELTMADVVLVGVSRASKSSTCFYLAYRGIRAANVPLLPHWGPTPELTKLDPRRVIGLTINARRLLALRQERMHTMGARRIDQYTDPETVADEVRSAHQQMARNEWRRIDVSFMAIEEIAKHVMRFMDEANLRRRPRRRRAR